MRTLWSPGIAILAAVGMLAGAAHAGQPLKQTSERQKVVEEQAVFVTGSLIPQRVKLKRIGTPTLSPIRVIDRREIDETGRRTTRAVLLTDPSLRVVGH